MSLRGLPPAGLEQQVLGMIHQAGATPEKTESGTGTGGEGLQLASSFQ